MNGIRVAACRVYALLLRLYPVSFQETYGDELYEVFHDLTWESRTRRGLVALCLREILGFPKNLFREHVDEFRRRNEMRSASEPLVLKTSLGSRIPVVGAMAFGLAFAVDGFVFSLFRYEPEFARLPAAFVFFHILPALVAGWVGAFLLVRVIAPAKALKAASWSGLTFLLATLVPSGVGLALSKGSSAISIAADAFLLYLQPFLQGAIVAATITLVLGEGHLWIKAGLASGFSFLAGFTANRLFLAALDSMARQFGVAFPPADPFLFSLSWIVSYSLVGILGGFALGLVLSRSLDAPHYELE